MLAACVSLTSTGARITVLNPAYDSRHQRRAG
jgi:hypothetical protein